MLKSNRRTRDASNLHALILWSVVPWTMILVWLWATDTLTTTDDNSQAASVHITYEILVEKATKAREHGKALEWGHLIIQLKPGGRSQ